MVAGAEFAGAADQAVELLQAGSELHELVVTEMGELWCETAAQDVAGRFGDLHTERCRRGDVPAAVLGVRLAEQQFFGLEQLDLAADAGLGLAEAVGDGPLLDARVPLQHH